MTEQQEKILAVLDMSEEEQVEFFYIKGYRQLVDTFPAGGLKVKYDKENNIISVKHSQSKLRFDRRALADLAFSKRNEAMNFNKGAWYDATKQVWRECHNYRVYRDFWVDCSKPIHWTIAALLALLAKESK